MKKQSKLSFGGSGKQQTLQSMFNGGSKPKLVENKEEPEKPLSQKPLSQKSQRSHKSESKEAKETKGKESPIK